MAFSCQNLKQPFPILRNTDTSGEHMWSCYGYSRSRRAGVHDLEKQVEAPWSYNPGLFPSEHWMPRCAVFAPPFRVGPEGLCFYHWRQQGKKRGFVYMTEPHVHGGALCLWTCYDLDYFWWILAFSDEEMVSARWYATFLGQYSATPKTSTPHPAITEDSPTGAIPASSSTLGPAAPGQPKVSELSIMSLYKEA